MGRDKGDHAPHHVQMLRHQGERRLQAVADVAGMVDDLGKIEQQTQLADRFAHALPMRWQHRRCAGSRPFLIRGGRIRRRRLLVSFHAQDSPFPAVRGHPGPSPLLPETSPVSFSGHRRPPEAALEARDLCGLRSCQGREHAEHARRGIRTRKGAAARAEPRDTCPRYPGPPE